MVKLIHKNVEDLKEKVKQILKLENNLNNSMEVTIRKLKN